MSSDREIPHARLSGTVSLLEGQEIAAAAYPSPPNSPPDYHSELIAEGFDKECSSSATISLTATTIPVTSPRSVTHPRISETASRSEVPKASTLKDLLGIKNWQCGGLRPEKKPCGWYISQKLRPQIDIHLHSMLMLHQSSPQLQADLEKLIDLVHCNHHKRGYARKIRLDTWTAIFPPGLDQTSCDASVEREIVSSFGQPTTQCIGIMLEKRRCKNRIGGQKAQHCTKTINEISKAGVYLNDVNLDHYLRVLEVNMYCHNHTNQSSLERVESWKERTVAIRERANEASIQLEESTTRESSERQIPNQDTSIKQKHTDSLKISDQRSPSPCSSIDCFNNPAAHWFNQYDTTPFDIIEKCNRPDDYKASYNAVWCQMVENLAVDDQEPGYVYAYEVKGNKGFVKIGYTSRSINTRHNEWSFDCNRDSIQLFPISSMKATLVPNARRVEALCHAELSHRRTIIYCHGCFRTHMEWFEVSPTEAIAVIQKWIKWMRNEPYQSDQLSLKEEEVEKASDMDHYMDCLSTLQIESWNEEKL